MKQLLQCLSTAHFLQYFAWGAWLISLSGYLINELNFTAFEVGAIVATSGFASLVSPLIIGYIADKHTNSERILGVLHLASALCIIISSVAELYIFMYLSFALYLIFFMPTIPVLNSITFASLRDYDVDIVKYYPRIKIWGVLGFIVALFFISITGFANTSAQMIVSGLASAALGVYSFALPNVPPVVEKDENVSTTQAIKAALSSLLSNFNVLAMLISCMLLGSCVMVSNTYTYPFLTDILSEADGLFGKYPIGLLSISQISELLLLIAVPFFIRKIGIKLSLILAALAWVVRFYALSWGGSDEFGMFILILAMAVYGVAFNFFNVSSAIYIEEKLPKKIRTVAQGSLFSFTNGFGYLVASYLMGFAIDNHTSYLEGTSTAIERDWPYIWQATAVAAMVSLIVIIFLRTKKDK